MTKLIAVIVETKQVTYVLSLPKWLDIDNLLKHSLPVSILAYPCKDLKICSEP